MNPGTPLAIPTDISLRPISARLSVPFKEDLTGYSLIFLAVAAAQIGLFILPQVGAYLTAGALALLMAIAAKYSRVRSVVLGVAILPLLGMINLTFVQRSAFKQTAVLYGAMFILSIIYRITLRRHARPVNASLYSKSLIGYGTLAIVLGFALGIMNYRLLLTNYVFGGVSIGLVAAVAVFGAISEESLFRGLIQRQAMAVAPSWFAWFYTSLLYLTIALSHFTLWTLLIGGVSTIVLSGLYYFKQNLWLTTSLNVMSKLVYIGLIARYLVH